MQIEIDPLSEVPLYQQLRDRIVEGIASGSLAEGDVLASVRQLAAQFGINPATVAKGYDLLRAEGLVRTHRKAGSVVARGPESARWTESAESDWTSRLTTLLAEAVAQGMPEERVLVLTTAALERFRDARRAAPRSNAPRSKKESA
jgi:GntR family transcriptional regulator